MSKKTNGSEPDRQIEFDFLVARRIERALDDLPIQRRIRILSYALGVYQDRLGAVPRTDPLAYPELTE